MTTREKNFIIAGSVLGFLLAGVLFGVARFIRRESTTAGVAPSSTSRQESTVNQSSREHEDRQHAPNPSHEPNEPLSSLQLTEDEQRSISLETRHVERRNIDREILAAARVEEPETKLASISARIAGRIDKLHVDFTGQPVRRGQPVAEIYSPEVLTAAEEYKLALENRKRLTGMAESEAISGADDLIAASRRRLELWGLTPQQISSIATSEKPQLDITIYSPASGIVTERKVSQGQYVNTGDVLYTVTDLRNVWIKADIYEMDLPQVHVGDSVEVTSESLANTRLHGRVEFLEPMVDPQTRTTAARMHIANPGLRLRPGMFVQARFRVKAGESLTVPRSAVVNTGERTLVYVAKGQGIYEAHQVQLGAVAGGYYPVLAGLHGGEQVVTEGNFMLDSQTHITGGMAGMFGGSKEFQKPANASQSSQWKIAFRSDPAIPKGGSEATLHASVKDEAGKPVTDAQIAITFFMPAMPAMGMSEMREAATLTWRGTEYSGSVKIPTSGTWTVTVEVSRSGQVLTTYRTIVNAR